MSEIWNRRIAMLRVLYTRSFHIGIPIQNVMYFGVYITGDIALRELLITEQVHCIWMICNRTGGHWWRQKMFRYDVIGWDDVVIVVKEMVQRKTVQLLVDFSVFILSSIFAQ